MATTYSESDTTASFGPHTCCSICSPPKISATLLVCLTFKGNGSEICISGEVESACLRKHAKPSCLVLAPLPQLLGRPIHTYLLTYLHIHLIIRAQGKVQQWQGTAWVGGGGGTISIIVIVIVIITHHAA